MLKPTSVLPHSCTSALLHSCTPVLLILTIVLLLTGCRRSYEHRTVVCIPVYGQSLALGEEAQRITDFDSLAAFAGGRIVTENLDHSFGCFDESSVKQWTKKLVGYHKRSFELSVYAMAETLATFLGEDTLVCVFPGGRGATAISSLGRGSDPYQRLLDDIGDALNEARSRGWDFVVPAVCWMQGESDIADYEGTRYEQRLSQFCEDINRDVLTLTGQQDSVRIICYQSTSITKGTRFRATEANSAEAQVPMSQLRLLQNHPLFWVSGPTYPYDCVGEVVHIDAHGQRCMGRLAALSALDIIHHGKERRRGLLPVSVSRLDGDSCTLAVAMNVPCLPLQIDTLVVRAAPHFGFSVITPDGRDVVSDVRLSSDTVYVSCLEPVSNGSHIHYGLLGEPMKSGRRNGPRGNLRDSQGDGLPAVFEEQGQPSHNWCLLFDLPIP